ncbi:hypothetical protein Dsin_000717 [Dipteronia sinensis]|uniref:Nucleolar protein 10 n=1 Tax=Dipteronia sinensis TaxID=43782 RepID=A0AAE0B2F4_9ROSI|nr:hypothetical protein Dsin_000717 [Dipteronia sinensis]
MYLQFYINDNGDKVYTTKKESPVGLPTESAHPARFSPDDKYSRQRVLLKKRFGLLPTQKPAPNHCGSICKGSFYRCVECDMNIHLECIPLPRAINHKCHCHPLTLTNSVNKDVFGEYYCCDIDACETEINPDYHAYCCEECIYIALIECVIIENEDAWQDWQPELAALSFDTKDESELEGLSLVEVNKRIAHRGISFRA